MNYKEEASVLIKIETKHKYVVSKNYIQKLSMLLIYDQYFT